MLLGDELAGLSLGQFHYLMQWSGRTTEAKKSERIPLSHPPDYLVRIVHLARGWMEPMASNSGQLFPENLTP